VSDPLNTAISKVSITECVSASVNIAVSAITAPVRTNIEVVGIHWTSTSIMTASVFQCFYQYCTSLISIRVPISSIPITMLVRTLISVSISTLSTNTCISININTSILIPLISIRVPVPRNSGHQQSIQFSSRLTKNHHFFLNPWGRSPHIYIYIYIYRIEVNLFVEVVTSMRERFYRSCNFGKVSCRSNNFDKPVNFDTTYIRFANFSRNESLWIYYSKFLERSASFLISTLSVCVFEVKRSMTIIIVNSFQVITNSHATALFLFIKKKVHFQRVKVQ
jgi:hypothetical protein